jgi:hypothetical protein
MKEDFISDKRRISYLSATYNRIYRGQSVLIEDDFGTGKLSHFKRARRTSSVLRIAIWLICLTPTKTPKASIITT